MSSPRGINRTRLKQKQGRVGCNERMEVDHLLAIQPEEPMRCAARVYRLADHIAALIKTGGRAPDIIRVSTQRWDNMRKHLKKRGR